MGSTIGAILGSFFFPHFWFNFGPTFGVILGSDWAKSRQDDPKEDIKSPKVPKNNIYKKCKVLQPKPYFLSLGGTQDVHKKFKKAPKRHLKSVRTSKRRVPKMDPKIDIFLGLFWS